MLCGRSENSPVVTVDLELGVVGSGAKIIAKSSSFDERPVHTLKIPETDSPRTTIYVPSTLPNKPVPQRTVEEDPGLGVLTHNMFDISTAIDRASSPSSESVSDDDRSSLDHSLESSATSGDKERSNAACKSDISHVEREQTRNGFYENVSATQSTQFDSVEVAEDGIGQGDQWEGHPEMFADDDLAETMFEVEQSSDESIYEDDPEIPSHRWLKFAIEFVWLHKLPNTIKEMDEDEGLEDIPGVKEVEEAKT
ncbi:hypothetical protein D9756_009803 [Leucocoprinus leucothites]|uniref:Uncharacterized protein n=1 Tax=Leucocoprinus leucothites TaxID=201217 RepID=A0A8H5CVQ9_9AGAR|nr:hypothetical protein D9756_009803 [Leucoagaricus leucothites]